MSIALHTYKKHVCVTHVLVAPSHFTSSGNPDFLRRATPGEKKFDHYSIMRATEYARKKKEEHNILVFIAKVKRKQALDQVECEQVLIHLTGS